MITVKNAGGLVSPATKEGKMDKIKIKIIQRTRCGGKTANPGDIVSASTADANMLINIGKAVIAPASKPKANPISGPKKAIIIIKEKPLPVAPEKRDINSASGVSLMKFTP